MQRPQPTPRPQGWLVPVMTVAGMVALLAAGLWLLLLFFDRGSVLAVVILTVALVGIPLLQWLCWGWWLGRVMRDESSTEEPATAAGTQPRRDVD